MANTTPALAVGGQSIRQLDGLFSLNDLHKASGGAAKHRPVEFLRLGQTKALIEEIEQGGNSHLALKVTHGGPSRGTYACRELVVAYAAWISPAFHLKVIRVFLDIADSGRRAELKREPVITSIVLTRFEAINLCDLLEFIPLLKGKIEPVEAGLIAMESRFHGRLYDAWHKPSTYAAELQSLRDRCEAICRSRLGDRS